MMVQRAKGDVHCEEVKLFWADRGVEHPARGAIIGGMQPAGLTERTARIIGIGGICVLFGYFLTYDNVRLSHVPPHFGDFPTFYHAARAMLDGRDPYVPYEADLSYVYPPLLAACYTPLAHLSKLSAARIMLPINIAFALTALLLGTRAIMRRLEVPITLGSLACIACLAGWLSENELRNQLQALETDALMLLCFTLALWWLDRRPIFAGAALAFALNIKYLSIITLPYLLLRRRWRAAIGMGIWTLIWGLLPALVLGWRENARCLRVALSGLLGWVGVARPAGAETAHVHGITDGLSLSVTSGLARVLEQHGASPKMGLVLAALLGLTGLMWAAWLYSGKGFPFLLWSPAQAQQDWPFNGLVAIEWVSLIVVALAFSPDTNARHLVLALLVNILAATMLLVPRPGVPRAPLAVGTILMFLGFIMPLKGWVTPKQAHAYFHYGIACWCLLGMYAVLLWTGLRYIKAGSTVIHSTAEMAAAQRK